MQEELTLIIQAVNQAQAILNQVKEQTEQIARTSSKAFEDSNLKIKRSSEGMFASLQRGWSGLSRQIVSVRGAMTGLLIGGIVKVASGFRQAATEMENLRASIGVFEKDVAGTFRELEQLSKLPGITLQGAAQGFQLLRAADIEKSLSIDIIREFGNALAIAGNPDNLQGILIQVQQMASAGKILTSDLRPILQQMPLMAKAIRDAGFDLKNLSEISTDEFLPKITETFAGMERATDKSSNAVSNLKNEFLQLSAAIGDILLPSFTVATNALSVALEKLRHAVEDAKRALTPAPGGTRMEILNNPLATPSDFVTATLIGDTFLPGVRNARTEGTLEGLPISENVRMLFERQAATAEARRQSSRADTRQILQEMLGRGIGGDLAFQFPVTQSGFVPFSDPLSGRIGATAEDRQRRIEEIFGVGGSTIIPGPAFNERAGRAYMRRYQSLDAPATVDLNSNLQSFLGTFTNDLTPTLEKSTELTMTFTNTLLSGFNDITNAADSMTLNIINSFLNLGIQISQLINDINGQGGWGALSGLSKFAGVGAVAGITLSAIAPIVASSRNRRESEQLQRVPRRSATAVR